MSDHAGGPGWWLASDGQWYPPEARPAGDPRPTVARPPVEPAGAAAGVVPGSPSTPSFHERSWPDDEPELPWDDGEPEPVPIPARPRWRSWWVVTGTCLLLLLCSGAAIVLIVDDGAGPTGTADPPSDALDAPPAVQPTVVPFAEDRATTTGSGAVPAPAEGDADAAEGPAATWPGRRRGDLEAALGATIELADVAATASVADEVVDPSPVDTGRFLRVEMTIVRRAGAPLLYNERVDLTLVDRQGRRMGSVSPAVASLGAGVLSAGDEVTGWVYFPLDDVLDGPAHVVYEPDTSGRGRAVWPVDLA